jgi:AsmA-like C-terminal region/Domain of Unknown Function (DUF748)
MTDSTGLEPVRPRRVGRIILIVLGSLVGVVLLAVVGGLLALENVVNSRKDTELAKLSAQLGRPVTAGKVNVKVLTGGRVVVNNLVIGRDPNIAGEPDPVLKVDRAFVNIRLLPVIFSLGKKLTVQEVAVEGLAVQVARLPDGRLNLQDIADKLPKSEAAEEKPEPIDEETRQKIRAAKLERLRLTDGRVRFVDLQQQGAPAAEIADLDVTLENVSLQNAFAVKVAAAVLGVKQNFHLDAQLGAAPDVPGEIAPPPVEKATIKLEPTPLRPLAPFLAAVATPELAELTDGTLAMDLQAVPGGAAPGGSGPTTLKGFLALAGAKFAGGQAFEARMDSDVSADVQAGTADIRQFVAKLSGTGGAAPMALTAKGKLADLLGAQPRVDGFTLESQGLDFSRIHEFYPPLDRTMGAVLRGPFTLQARGSGAAAGTGQVDAKLDLTPASIEVPGQFRKPPGTPLVLELVAVAEPNLLRADRVLLTMANWTIKASGSLRTQGTGKSARQSFQGTVEAPMIPVRQLVALVAPKQLAEVPDVKVAAKASASGTVGSPRSMKVDVPSFQLAAGKSDLAGSLSLENLEAPRVAFQGRSKYLDMDDFLPPSEKARKATEKAAGKAAGKTSKTDKPDTGEQPPEILQKLDGVAKLTVDRGRAADLDYSNLKADLAVKKGRLAARALEVDALGGHFSGAGSEFPLVEKNGLVVARGEVQRMDVAQALATFADKRNLLAGKLSAKIDVTGKGAAPELIKQSLNGELSGSLEDGKFLPVSLLEPVAATLMDAADKFPSLGKSIRATAERATILTDKHLRDLKGTLAFARGAAQTVKPLQAITPGGPVSVDGKIDLDGLFNMLARLQLKPEVATALTGGKVRFDQPIPVDLKITGPLAKPIVRPADPVALTKVFAMALAKTEAGQLLKEKAGVALERTGVPDAQVKVDEARARAQQAEAEAAQRAEAAKAEAQQKADQAKQEAADKAKESAKGKLRGLLGR